MTHNGLNDRALAGTLAPDADDGGEEPGEGGVPPRGGGGVLQLTEAGGQELQGLRHGERRLRGEM